MKKVIICLLAVLSLSAMSAFAQECMFICADDGPRDTEQIIIQKFQEWGYNVTPVLSSELASFDATDYADFDFAFASEAISSSSLAPLKLMPIPLVNTEGWASKPTALAYCTEGTAANVAPEPVVIVDNTDHPLAAGYKEGDEVELVTDPAALLITTFPNIDVIYIGDSSLDPSKSIIYGIEAGTELVDGDVTENRAVCIGIHEYGFASITDAGYAFIKAAIEWVTEGSGGNGAGGECMFICADDGPRDTEQIIIQKFEEWGYNVTPVLSSELTAFVETDYADFDFAFASEAINSSSLAPLKLMPIPLVNTEGWASKPTVLAYCTEGTAANVAPEPMVIVDNTDHPLAAGYKEGDEVELVTDPAALLITTFPNIDVIYIGDSSLDPSKSIIYGIEAGTELVDGDVTENRAVCIGIHEYGFASITDAGYAFIKAAIEWVTDSGSSAVKENSKMPVGLDLSQNYPNPFNPETTVRYSLEKSAFVNCAIYNIKGQAVANLVDSFQPAGTYQVKWVATGFESGVYFMHVKAGEYSETRKLILQK